jgi:hypothetical protein
MHPDVLTGARFTHDASIPSGRDAAWLQADALDAANKEAAASPTSPVTMLSIQCSP